MIKDKYLHIFTLIGTNETVINYWMEVEKTLQLWSEWSDVKKTITSKKLYLDGKKSHLQFYLMI